MTLKLLQILKESAAAEEAKQRGYTARPYGYWEKDGKIVARTQDDKLVPVKQDDSSADTSQGTDPKPTTMSAQQAGTKPSNVVTTQDAEKSAGGLDSPKDGESSIESSEVSQPIPEANPHRFTMSFGTPVDRSEIGNHLDLSKDDYNYAEERVVGEEVYICDRYDIGRLIENPEYPNGFKEREVLKMSDEDAQRQHAEWREKLSPADKKKLLNVQTDWQVVSQYMMFESERDKNNKFLSSLPPAEIETFTAIERGMKFDGSDLDNFFEGLRIGEDYDIPPSGFSADWGLARSYANSGRAMYAGVLVRLLPKDGVVYGIHLHDLPLEHYQSVLGRDEGWKRMTKLNSYSVEREIIRPSGPKARCIGIKKLLYPNSQNGTIGCTYILDFEEQGYESDITEGIVNKDRYKEFSKLMNTPLAYSHEENSAKLTDMMTGVLA